LVFENPFFTIGGTMLRFCSLALSMATLALLAALPAGCSTNASAGKDVIENGSRGPSDTSASDDVEEDAPATRGDSVEVEPGDSGVADAREDVSAGPCQWLFGVPNDKTGLAENQCKPVCNCEGVLFEPPEYTEVQIKELESRVLVEPMEPPSADPYAGPEPEAPTPGTVCAVLGDASVDGGYRLKTFKSVEEAEKAAEDMRRASEKILSACVNPRPRPEHEAEIFRFVSGITNEAIRKVDDMFFPQRSDNAPSGRIRAVDKGKTKQDFGS